MYFHTKVKGYFVSQVFGTYIDLIVGPNMIYLSEIYFYISPDGPHKVLTPTSSQIPVNIDSSDDCIYNVIYCIESSSRQKVDSDNVNYISLPISRQIESEYGHHVVKFVDIPIKAFYECNTTMTKHELQTFIRKHKRSNSYLRLVPSDDKPTRIKLIQKKTLKYYKTSFHVRPLVTLHTYLDMSQDL